MSNNNVNKPRFSAYWIYALLIFAILGYNFYSGGNLWTQPKEIPQSKFEEFLRNGDVSKTVIVNKKRSKCLLNP